MPRPSPPGGALWVACLAGLWLPALNSGGAGTAGIPGYACVGGGGSAAGGYLLRLRGGALRERPRRKQMDEPVRMELDDAEQEAAVKGRRSRRGALVLDGEGGARGEGAREPENPGTKLERLLREGMPQRYHHGKKVVVEKPPRLKVRRDREEEPILALGSKVAKRGASAVVKRVRLNCTLAAAHGLFNVSDLATYLGQRIKVNGETGARQSAVRVEVDGDDIVVSATHATQLKRKRTWSRKLCLSDAFSTRYIKYLTRKFICKVELRYIVRLVSTDFSLAARAAGGQGQLFELRYTNIHKNRNLKLKYNSMMGTRLEAARRDLLDSQWDAQDDKMVQINRDEQYMERRIKTTGERVGGIDHILRTRKTIGEVKRDNKELLRHWIALQHRSYRAPFGGAMRGVMDKSITRHDPDRVGKGARARSTAGYSMPRVHRSMQGTKAGLESLMYTGTAPHGFKSARQQLRAQKTEWKNQIARYKAKKGWSVAGDADRAIYNWKPKHLFSGKMNLHKRDWR